MANRESIGLVAMTLAFVLVVGGVGGFVILRNAGEMGFGGRSPDSLLSRGQTAANRDDFVTALNLFAAAIDAAPDRAEPYVARGDLYLRMGDPRSAHDDYSAAILRDAGSPRALLGRAQMRQQMEDPDGAIEDYGRLIDRNPTHTGALRGRARLYKVVGNFPAAVADFERVIEIDPDLNRIDADIAWAYWGAGAYEAALAAFDRAVDGRRGHMHDRFGRGVTLYHLGRLDDARLDLERARDAQRPGYVYAAYYLWLTMVRGGDRNAADKMLAGVNSGARDEWPAQIGRFLTAQITEEEFIDHAAAGTWQPANEQLCEAHYYAGAVRLIEGEKAAATDHFRRCVETGVNNFYEYFSAMEELRKLGE